MDDNNTPTQGYKMTKNQQRLLQFVTSHTDLWREHRDTNYLKTWDEYERLWRGMWTGSDKNRESERSQIVTPAIRQAIDSRQAEIEEAIFGRKDWFDVDDDEQDKEKGDIALLKANLREDFKRDKIKKSITQINQLGEVYGTGIGELVIKESTKSAPASQDIGVPGLKAVGVMETERVSLRLKPVSPKNFIIDPNALDIDDAMGCAVEEFISLHTIVAGMVSGAYRKCPIGETGPDDELEPVQNKQDYDRQRVKVLRYYGLVPRELLENLEDSDKDALEDELEDDEIIEEYEENYGDMVEALIVIGNEAHLLKAVENPYMMKDRPIVVYRPEIITGRFFGCGTVEKGYNMQKALDGQMRAHMDATALATAPMMGMDATRMPRGFKFEIRPGRTVLTNGDPKEVLYPFNFGQVNPVSVQTAQLFERYLQQATGTLDSAGLPQQVGNQADTGGMAIAISGILKKHKRALINFQEDFLMPFVEKAAYRFMQFAPDRYPVKDVNFIPTSTLGIMAREYEQQQFIGLLQTLGPQSPIVPLILKGIIENSSLSKREELVKALEAMSQPNPAAEQAQQQQQQLLMAEQQAKVQKTQAEAQKTQAEAEVVPIIAQAKLTAATSNNLDDDNEGQDFANRAKIMELQIKKLDLDTKERDSIRNLKITEMQQATKLHEVAVKDRTARLKIERDAQGNISSVNKE